jgi:hypothetical protein
VFEILDGLVDENKFVFGLGNKGVTILLDSDE